MSNLKMLISACVLFVVSLALPVGNAFAGTECNQSCIPLSTECDYSGSVPSIASFEFFTPSSTIYNGFVCHPNKDYIIHVTTSAFDPNAPTLPGHRIEQLPPSYAYDGAFVNGHPYYRVDLAGQFNPSTFLSNFVAVELAFISSNSANVSPEIYIEVFGVGDPINPIHTETLAPTNTAAPGTQVTVSTFINTMAAEVTHFNITTTDKLEFLSFKFEKVG